MEEEQVMLDQRYRDKCQSQKLGKGKVGGLGTLWGGATSYVSHAVV